MMSAENTVLETAMDALYRYVAPARSWAFECVALLQLREKFPSDPKVQTQLESCIERFEQTFAALQGEIAICFEKAEHPPKDEMFAIHKACVAAVEDMLRRVRTCYKHQPSDAELLEMLQLCQGHFWEAMSEFVTAFSQYQRDILAYRADQDTKVMREAIVEIVDLSSSINLISVNASVEAARAGVAGRGFAVIANEIRNLSLKSQDLTEFVRSRLT